MAIICMHNIKRVMMPVGVSGVKICNKPTSPAFSLPLTSAPLVCILGFEGVTLSGQTPFLQTFPRMESCHVCWAAVQSCRPQGPGPSPGRGAHAGSIEGKAGEGLGTMSLTLRVALCSRSQGLATACVVARHWCRAEEAPRPPQRLFAELVTAAGGC